MSDACCPLSIPGAHCKKRVGAQTLQCALIEPAQRQSTIACKFGNRAVIRARVEEVRRQSSEPAGQVVAAR